MKTVLIGLLTLIGLLALSTMPSFAQEPLDERAFTDIQPSAVIETHQTDIDGNAIYALPVSVTHESNGAAIQVIVGVDIATSQGPGLRGGILIGKYDASRLIFMPTAFLVMGAFGLNGNEISTLYGAKALDFSTGDDDSRMVGLFGGVTAYQSHGNNDQWYTGMQALVTIDRFTKFGSAVTTTGYFFSVSVLAKLPNQQFAGDALILKLGAGLNLGVLFH